MGAFYREHFSSFDRQIVLVDVISALNAGPDTFRDMQKSLEVVLESFDYGRIPAGSGGCSAAAASTSWCSPRPKRTTSPPPSTDNLRSLLTAMVNDARTAIGFRSALQPDIQVLSAIRCTETVEVPHEGQTLPCVRGIASGSDEQKILYPGEVPLTPPTPEAVDARPLRVQGLPAAPGPGRDPGPLAPHRPGPDPAGPDWRQILMITRDDKPCKTLSHADYER